MRTTRPSGSFWIYSHLPQRPARGVHLGVEKVAAWSLRGLRVPPSVLPAQGGTCVFTARPSRLPAPENAGRCGGAGSEVGSARPRGLRPPWGMCPRTSHAALASSASAPAGAGGHQGLFGACQSAVLRILRDFRLDFSNDGEVEPFSCVHRKLRILVKCPFLNYFS